MSLLIVYEAHQGNVFGFILFIILKSWRFNNYLERSYLAQLCNSMPSGQ